MVTISYSWCKSVGNLNFNHIFNNSWLATSLMTNHGVSKFAQRVQKCVAKSEVAGLVVVGPQSIPYLYSHCEVSVPISSFIEQGQAVFTKLVRLCQLRLC